MPLPSHPSAWCHTNHTNRRLSLSHQAAGCQAGGADSGNMAVVVVPGGCGSENHSPEKMTLVCSCIVSNPKGNKTKPGECTSSYSLPERNVWYSSPSLAPRGVGSKKIPRKTQRGTVRDHDASMLFAAMPS